MREKFAANVYQSRRHYRRTCERPNKGDKAIERTFISSYQFAQSLGFNGDFRVRAATDSRLKDVETAHKSRSYRAVIDGALR